MTSFKHTSFNNVPMNYFSNLVQQFSHYEKLEVMSEIMYNTYRVLEILLFFIPSKVLESERNAVKNKFVR
jgi:hypothetical protein